jgi:hypothetical protein
MSITPELIAEFKRSAKNLKPWKTWYVSRLNGTSWDYITVGLISPEVSPTDRRELAAFVRKAMTYSAAAKRGVLASFFRPVDPVVFFADLQLPPEPASGPFADDHRVERHQSVAAKVLLRVERDPKWYPAGDEMREIQRFAGIRV